MSEESRVEKVPQVFISYSHDSEDHGAWVLRLAERLVTCGIDVDFDQWGLGLGDDVAKYMEKGVSEADRVLMICTEQYVRKADEGKGGVGYEAMIVTGELVKNLGTNKFIPVVRQTTIEPSIPRSVSTRIYVNLSEGKDIENEFEKLVREIHQTPKVRKPSIGTNPYRASSRITMEGNFVGTSSLVGEMKIEEAESAYVTGLQVARDGDFSAWRQLVRSVKAPLSARLMEWRKKYDGATSIQIQALPGMVADAAKIYSPLMAVALAGVESGQSKFNNQTGVLDELLRPKDWNSAGLTVVGSIPDALVFTYQALHGATCVEVGELSLAIALSRARVARAHHFEGEIVYEDHQFMGWPESFNHTCTMAWHYLASLPERWPWLNRIFGTADEFRASLSAYYMGLNIQELALVISRGQSEILQQKEIRLDIPVAWLGFPLEIKQRAYRKLTQAPDQLRSIWRSLGVDDAAMAKAWPKWMEHVQDWITNVNEFSPHDKPVYAILFDDIRHQQ